MIDVWGIGSWLVGGIAGRGGLGKCYETKSQNIENRRNREISMKVVKILILVCGVVSMLSVAGCESKQRMHKKEQIEADYCKARGGTGKHRFYCNVFGGRQRFFCEMLDNSIKEFTKPDYMRDDLHQ